MSLAPSNFGDDAVPKVGTDRSFASLILIYNCGLIWSSVVFMTGGPSLFGYAHGFLVLSICGMLIAYRRQWQDILLTRIRSWSAFFLIGFLAYYLAAIVLYPDREVADYHLRGLVVRIIPNLLMGYLAFVSIPALRRASRWAARPESSLWGIRLDFFALVLFAGVTIWALFTLVPLGRKDYFLIPIAPDRVMYQLFGIYAVTALICAYVLIYGLWSRYRQSTLATAACAAAVASPAIALFFLCQLVASNSGSSLSAAIGGGLGMLLIGSVAYDAWSRKWQRAGALLAVGLVSLLIFAVLVANVPPLRILGFSQVATQPDIFDEPAVGPQGSGAFDFIGDLVPSSVTSRLDIFLDSGLKQISYAPIWGDIGVEHVVGSAGVLHTLHDFCSISFRNHRKYSFGEFYSIFS